MGPSSSPLSCCRSEVLLLVHVLSLLLCPTFCSPNNSRSEDRARHLLSKPIKFFPEMEELFQGSNADDSLAMDQETCLLDDGNKSDSSDGGGINDMSCYAQPVDLDGDDSDTLPSPKSHKTSPNCAASGSSSSTPRSGMKRPRGVKSPSKKPRKAKSCFSRATEEISTTMEAIAKALAEPPPPPPVPQLGDAHAGLWKRLEALPIATKDKISVGEHLASPGSEGMRSFLAGSSE